jgi:outer membrane protein TolC
MNPNQIKMLQDLVGLHERRLAILEAQHDAGKASEVQVIEAEIDLVKARLDLDVYTSFEKPVTNAR